MDIYGYAYGGIMDPLKNISVDPELFRIISRIDEFKGRWEALSSLAPERLSSLKRIATIESVGSSTRIEGVTLSDDEIEKLLTGLQIKSFHTRDEQEVAGYADLMELIFTSWRHIEFTENHILQLHSVLLNHSTKDERHRGQYKKLPNHVEAFDVYGQSLGVIFQTSTPFDTPRLMEELITWTRESLEADKQHPIIIIATFVLRFLAIHPFQDGNGRLSRVLTTLLLMRSGYEYVPYSSLERVVEDNKDQYYKMLRKGQTTIDKDESQFSDWLSFFVRCLIKQKELLENRISRERLMSTLSPLSEKILQIAREHGRLTVRDVVRITDSNRNTVKAHIKQMVNSGHLSKQGRGKGTWYEKKK